MKIHEYQAKELFQKYGVPIPQGRVAFSPVQAVEIAETLDGYPVVIKAQIHAGGRGKGGGVKLAQSEPERVQWHVMLTQALLRSGNLDAAEGVIDTALKQHPDSAELNFLRAVVHLNRQQLNALKIP